jgi:aspartyl-tRNA synthetase
MRILSNEIISKEGEAVLMSGWVAARRDHGKIIFIDLRDRQGITQIVFTPKNKEVYEEAQKLRSEWVIEVEGKVGRRPKGMENPDIANGELEIQVEKLTILNTAETLPLPIDNDGYEINENTRLQYRYLDLRRRRLLKNLEQRHKIIQFTRNFLSKEGFIEIETPILGKSTPEGARDYLVPSRIQSGKFYALPQSPQQYKQLLMVAGMEKYFQVARCFRDEDTRGDRQPEFTQLDMEMSFVKREDVMDVNERALIDIVKNFYPDKKIQELPFPRLSYKEVMEKYKTDRPDLRKDKTDPNLLAFCWVIDFPFFEKTDEDGGGKPGWTFTHNPFSAPKPEYMKDLLEKKNIGDILTTQYDIVLNGFEIGGGSIRNHRPEALEAVFEIMGYQKERIKNNFGHMLESFSYGAPPHGGIAWGLDRLMAILQNEPNIREVITFPKTGDGRDLMMGAPSEVEEKQLKELHIKIK